MRMSARTSVCALSVGTVSHAVDRRGTLRSCRGVVVVFWKVGPETLKWLSSTERMNLEAIAGRWRASIASKALL